MSGRKKHGETRENDGVNGTPVTDELLERINRRAFELYQLRGEAHGHDTEDWLEAERQVRLEMADIPREKD